MSSPQGVTIRPLRSEDFHDLSRGLAHMYDELAAGESVWITLRHVPPSEADYRKWFDRLLDGMRTGESITNVAQVDSRAVGHCTIERARPGPTTEQSHVGELGILVQKGHRGTGIGARLLERSLDEARQKFDIVYLTVWSKNVEAQRLYRRFGFTLCGHFPHTLKRNGQYFDEDRMFLALTDPPGRAGAKR
ncbi:MAG: GNAT family N-acetyltransferase [Thermoplasmata archaeon]|jgi:RimJ/RimL family protein N-acetyltransferase